MYVVYRVKEVKGPFPQSFVPYGKPLAKFSRLAEAAKYCAGRYSEARSTQIFCHYFWED